MMTRLKPFFFVLILATLPVCAVNTLGHAFTHPRTAGPQRVVTILVEFPDLKHSVTRDAIHELVFIEMNKYFTEVSYNKTWITGDTVEQWIMMPKKFAAYRLLGWYAEGREDFAKQAIWTADDRVDFRKYDYVMLFIPNVWDFVSYSIWGRSIQTQDGVAVTRIAMQTETHPERFVFHEFAHLLGQLPDLYDYDLAAENADAGIYVGSWDLMGFSPTMYTTPPHLTAFNKIRLGWIESENIKTVPADGVDTVDVYPIELKDQRTYAIRITLTSRAYYLVEVRELIGYDRDLPDEGVLISLVNENRESGHGIVQVQDSEPSTSTLDDATFDLRAGRQAGFFDRKNDVSIVITGKSGQSYTLFVGPVIQGEAVLKRSEKLLAATEAIAEAEASIQEALAEGRTEGIDMAKALIANASAAFDREDYDVAVEFAQEAADFASRAVTPQVTSTSTASTAVTQLSTRTYVPEQAVPAQLSPSQTVAAIIAGIVAIGVVAVLYRRRQVSPRNR